MQHIVFDKILLVMQICRKLLRFHLKMSINSLRLAIIFHITEDQAQNIARHFHLDYESLDE